MPHCRARKFLYESVRNSCVHHSSRFVTECVKHSEDEIDERKNGGVRFRASAHRHCGVGALSLAVRNGDMHAIGLHFRMRDDAFRSVSLFAKMIADACGFVDQSHFTKVFSRETGVTPAVWRAGYIN